MLDDRECIICNDVEEYALNELTLVKCKNCDVFFHKICYGISNNNSPVQGIVVLCDPCQYELKMKGQQLNKLSSTRNLKCLICFNPGILKRVLIPSKFSIYQDSDSKINSHTRAIWIHVECAVYSPDYILVNNWKTMSSIEILRPLVYRNANQCSICSSKLGLLRKCNIPQCLEYFHIHCLLRSPSYRSRNLNPGKNHILGVHCLKHIKTGSQIRLEQGKEMRKTIIDLLRCEIKALESGRNLNKYILNVLEFNNGELFSLPDFLYPDRSCFGLTLLFVIILSDIWTLRTTAFLSLGIQTSPEDCLSAFTVSKKHRISEWIELSSYIPVCTKYVENLSYISSQVSNALERGKKEHSKLKITNSVLYHIHDVKLMLYHQCIFDWENKHSEFFLSLKTKSNRSGLDINELKQILQDLPMLDSTERTSRIVKQSSGLYMMITSIFNKIRRLNFELDRVCKSRILDIDKLRFLGQQIETNIPRNSPINYPRFRRALNYSKNAELAFIRRIQKLKFTYCKPNVDTSSQVELDPDFQALISDLDKLKSQVTPVDHIVKSEMEVDQSELYETDLSLALGPEQVFKDWESFEYGIESRSTITAIKLMAVQVTSRRIKSMVRELNKLHRWEHMVNNSFRILTDLEKKHLSYSQTAQIEVCQTLREKFQRFSSLICASDPVTTSFIQNMSIIKDIFDQNCGTFSKSKTMPQYHHLLGEFTKIRELECFFEQEPDPGFTIVMLFINFVLDPKFRLLPRKQFLAGIFSKLERYLSLRSHISTSLQTQEISFRDAVILNRYWSLNIVDSQSDDESLSFDNDFAPLISGLRDKFKANLDLVGMIHFMTSTLRYNPDPGLMDLKEELDPVRVSEYLVGSCEKFDTPIQALFGYFEDSDMNSKVPACDETVGLEGLPKALFSLESYRKLFMDVVKRTDFDRDLHIIEQRDPETVISIPFLHKMRLIQRYYVVEVIGQSIAKDSTFQTVQDMALEALQSQSLDTLCMIWRNLRFLDTNGNLFESLECFKSIGSWDMRDARGEFPKNDSLYAFTMKHLTERVSVHFFENISAPSSIDDYLMDLDYIMKSRFLGESETRNFDSEIGEVKQLEESIHQIVLRMNSDHFKRKKELIEEILGHDLNSILGQDLTSLSRGLGGDQGPEIYVHQPICFEEEMVRDRLSLDFPTKKRNDFFSRMPMEDLFQKSSVSIITSANPNMFKSHEPKGYPGSKGDQTVKAICGLLNEYLSILEDERNQILLILGKSSRFNVVSGNSLEENKEFLGFNLLFKDFIRRKKDISSTLDLLHWLVNELMHVETAFVINLARLSQKSLSTGYLNLREWFNQDYLRQKTPYMLFNSAEILGNRRNCTNRLYIFGIFREISMKYLRLVDEWDRRSSRIVELSRGESEEREFYDVLIIYNQSNFLKMIFNGETDSVSPKSYHNLSKHEASFRERSEIIRRGYQRLRALLADLMTPYMQYMNRAFCDILENGLYGSKYSTRFLAYFPPSLIDSLRNRGPDKFSEVPRRIFVEEISTIFFSKEQCLLLVKLNMSYKCEYFYTSPELLVLLSCEIDLKPGILNLHLIKESHNLFDQIYRDSLVTERYYYIKEGRMDGSLTDLVNKRLTDFEVDLRRRASSLCDDQRPRRSMVDLSLEPFRLGGKGDQSRAAESRRYIVVTDIIDLISNVLQFRMYMSSLLEGGDSVTKESPQLLDYDVALKLMVMYYSLRELVRSVFPRAEMTDIREEVFIPAEIFSILRELSVLGDLLNKEEVSLEIDRRPKIYHCVFEREMMLMEDFRVWEIASDRYVFRVESCESKALGPEVFLSDTIWVPEYENFSTVLGVIDSILSHIRKIGSNMLDSTNVKQISKLAGALEARRGQILELETKSLKLLREIKQDETENCRFDVESELFTLLEKVISPPKISQKMVYDLISRRLVEVVPSFKMVNNVLNILPFKGFEVLSKYFKESVSMDKCLASALERMGDLEKRHDLETRKEMEAILSSNFEYLLIIMDLRRWINGSKLSSEALYKSYLKYFRGIIRYFLIYGTRARWVKAPGPRDQEDRQVFVPILEYTALKRLHDEFLSWYKYCLSGDYTKGAFENCEFIILESLLSCSRYLMEKVSFNPEKEEGDYLINHCVLRYLYFQEEEPDGRTKSLHSMIGILDIGEYLGEYLEFLEMELIMRQDVSRSEGPRESLEFGSFSVFGRVDNKLIHHFLKKNKVKVSIVGSRSPSNGLISNIYYVNENRERMDFGWLVGCISYPMKPVNAAYFLRNYVKQYLEYIFKAFYLKEDHDYIKKKDHALYLSALDGKDQVNIGNLFRVLDSYLKGVMNYSLGLIQKSFKMKSCNNHHVYSNLSKYPSFVEKFTSKWLVFSNDKWICEMIQIESTIVKRCRTSNKRGRDEKRDQNSADGSKNRILDTGGGESLTRESSNTSSGGKSMISEGAESQCGDKGATTEGQGEGVSSSVVVKCHEGVKSKLRFAWLGWLGLEEDGETTSGGLEIGIYPVSRQFTKRSDDILREMNRCQDLRYNGVSHSVDAVGRALGANSMVVLVSSNWSHHLRTCTSSLFRRIFHCNYEYEDYEVFEFELVCKEGGTGSSNSSSSVMQESEEDLAKDIRLLIFPSNLSCENLTGALYFGASRRAKSVPLPISKHYLLGMVVLKSEMSQEEAPGGDDGDQGADEEMSMVAGLLPDQEQMYKIAQYCHNMSVKSQSKMEFLINNDMFSSAGTLLSSLLSINSGYSQEAPFSESKEEEDHSNSICTLRDLANSLKRRISEG
ncbi:signal peptide-containing protein [Cryptosporidium canis]|uniref:Signal peptide-containing protein n=1 Tax=Cryptosporidium canis TaxID=195482 RepID=A0ABQ8P364_9CRYT|nr:signal peptide-containing protein [Cryptosporidium canis]